MPKKIEKLEKYQDDENYSMSDFSFRVVNVNQGPILSVNACKQMGLVKFCNL